MQITEPAPAKINLALHIRRRRPDGYHDLETLFAFARDGDVVTVSEADRDGFAITGPFASSLTSAPNPSASPGKAGAQDREARDRGTPLGNHRDWAPAFAGEASNLVVRAAIAFRGAFGLPPVAILLEKSLPVASGVGGGSADAAATLRALAGLTGVDRHAPKLYSIAASLGADVPACLLGQTAFATGRGDELAPLPPLGDLPLLLVNPLAPLSTAAMFAAWDAIDRGPIAREGGALDRAAAGRNDLTASALAAAPVIAEILGLLDEAAGCTLARLSGSGATCFGLFVDDASRDDAAVAAARRGWWTLATAAR